MIFDFSQKSTIALVIVDFWGTSPHFCPVLSLLYAPILDLPFPIALKISVLSAFEHKNAPQLRLYQNWGANMAKNAYFDTMHPLLIRRVHFELRRKLSLLIDKWRGCKWKVSLLKLLLIMSSNYCLWIYLICAVCIHNFTVWNFNNCFTFTCNPKIMSKNLFS